MVQGRLLSGTAHTASTRKACLQQKLQMRAQQPKGWVVQAKPAVAQDLAVEEVVLGQAGLLLLLKQTEALPKPIRLCGSAVAFLREVHPGD